MSGEGTPANLSELRSLIDRVLRLKQEEDGVKDLIKDVYKEAAGNGFDKTAMGKLVTHLRKAASDPEGEATKSANFDLYLEAYTNAPSHTHAGGRVREAGHDSRARRSKARLSESMADHKDFSAELASAGLISAEAHAENIAIADGVARKLGAGVLPAHDPLTGEITQPAAASVGAGATGAEAQAAPVAAPVATTEPTRIETAPDSDGSHDVMTSPAETSVSHQEPLSNGSGGMQAEDSEPSPQPVSQGFAPKKGDPFLDPNHKYGSIYRSSLCYQLGIAERDFDAVRAMMIAGYTAPAAIAALNEAA